MSAHPELKPSQKLPTSPARTRFAPSPTGNLHLGSLRTALYNYLIAKATGGQFLLRIEDTDQARTAPGAQDGIYKDLRWAGLEWDEGPEVGGPYGPYVQSERTALYQQHGHQLLASGYAYRCFCSRERLSTLAQERSRRGLPTDYDRTCAGISRDESDDRASQGHLHTLRLKVPEHYPPCEDLVYGKVGKARERSVRIKHGERVFEDPVLLKSDGRPTYHLANVVDDHHMKITHVVRAAEWLSSTPKHLVLYDAFGWSPPAFAHVGLLQDNAGQKLSKRRLDMDLEAFRQEGIFPEALLNYVALLGWSHYAGTDFLTKKQLIEQFNLKFTRGNAVVNPEKLEFLQKRHARYAIHEHGSKFDAMVDSLLSLYRARQHGEPVPAMRNEPRAYITQLLEADGAQFSTAKAFLERNLHLLEVNLPSQELLMASYERVANDSFVSDFIRDRFLQPKAANQRWDREHLHETLQALVAEIEAISRLAEREHLPEETVHSGETTAVDTKTAASKSLMRWLRWALAGGRPGPTILDTMLLLGSDLTIQRLDLAVKVTRMQM